MSQREEISEGLRAFVHALKGHQCAVSGCKEFAVTLDHIVPVSKGGKTTVENLQPMCSTHNSMKGDEDNEEFLFGLQVGNMLEARLAALSD